MNTYYLDKCRERNNNSFCRPFLNHLPPLTLNDPSYILKQHPECQNLIIVEYIDYIIIYITDDIKYTINIYYKNSLLNILHYLNLLKLDYITNDKEYGLANLSKPPCKLHTLNLNYLAKIPINFIKNLNTLTLKNYTHHTDNYLFTEKTNIYILDITNLYFSNEDYLQEFIRILLNNPKTYIRLSNIYLTTNFSQKIVSIDYLLNFYTKLDNGFYKLLITNPI